MVCVRENSEGEYAGVGGRARVGTPYEVAEQTGVFTRNGIERILRYGFEVAVEAAAEDAGERHEVQRPGVLDGAVGRSGRAVSARTTRRSSTGNITSMRWPHAW